MNITEYDDDGYWVNRLATPDEETKRLMELSEFILGTLYDGAKSKTEMRDMVGRGNTRLLDMILFAHPNIAKIGNTKSRKYYYTEDPAKGLPWLYA